MSLLKNIRKGDTGIWIIFFCLCLISVVEVFSAQSELTYKTGYDYVNPMVKHIGLLGVGVFLMLVVSNTQCKYFKLMTPIVLFVSFISLILVYFIGEKAQDTNDAARWIPIGGFHFQPSELAKGSCVLAVAQILSAMQTPGGTDRRAFKYILSIVIPICALIFIENFSTAFLLGLVILIMMIVGGVSWRQLVPFIGICLLLIGCFLAVVFAFAEDDTKKTEKEELVLTETVTKDGHKLETQEKTLTEKVFHRFGTWKKRILDFTNPEDVPAEEYKLNDHMQVGHANIAIVNSRGYGRGPGNSKQCDYLPQAYSDFIYAIIIEELGIEGAFVVMMLYIFLLFRTAKIANRCENSFPAFLIMGLALMLTTQAMFNMMVAVGLGPVTGQPLPLISKGGSAAILNCIYIGMILSVSHSAKKNPELANA